MTDEISAEAYTVLVKQPKEGKYHNKKETVDGITFQSRAEARRYQDLKLMELAGEIEDLELQPRYPLVVNGVKIATYVGDFRYFDTLTRTVAVEDVKSKATVTPVYKLKRNLMAAVHGITIREVT